MAAVKRVGVLLERYLFMVHLTRSHADPVFIVGMNGSGTTMLADCFENSDQMYVFPRETRVVPMFLKKEVEYGDLSEDRNFQQLLHDITDTAVFRVMLGTDVIPIEQVEDRSAASIIDRVYRTMAMREGKSRWMEKSPMNAQFLPLLAEQFPSARFVHIIRDGRDIAQSNKRRWNKNPIWSAYRWKHVVAKAMQDGRQLGPERYCEVRYEDVTVNPSLEMQQLCEFLDVPFDEDLLRSSMPFLHDGGRRGSRKDKSGTIINTGQKWKTFFSDDEVAAIENVIGEFLDELDYEVVSSYGHTDPSRASLLYWQLSDTIHLTSQIRRRQGFFGGQISLVQRAKDWYRFRSMLRY